MKENPTNTVPSQAALSALPGQTEEAVERVKADLAGHGVYLGLYMTTKKRIADLRAILAALDAEKEKVARHQKVSEAQIRAFNIVDDERKAALFLVTTLQAKLAEAKRVIEPFGKAAEKIPHHLQDDESLIGIGVANYMHTGDLRAAAAWLAANPTPEAK